MKLKFDEVVTLILNAAYEEAKAFGHTLLTPEHVLHTAIRFKHIEYILKKMHISVPKLKYEVRDYLVNLQINEHAKIENSPGFEKMLEKARISCIKDGRTEVSSKDIILALIEIEEQQSTYFFKSREINVKTFEKQLLELNLMQIIVGDNFKDIANNFDFEPEDGLEFQEEFFEEAHQKDHDEIYKKHTQDLTDLVRTNNKHRVILREKEIHNIIEILLKKNKNNPLIVGDSGIGKNAIVEELAFRIANNKIPAQLKKKKILRLSVVSLIAGTRYRGDFEDRVSQLLLSLENDKNVILLLDDLYAFVQGNSVTNANNDYSIFVKPLLQETKIPVIAITDPINLKFLEKSPSILRNFTQVRVYENTMLDTQKILEYRKHEYESFYGVIYTPEAIQRTVQLSEKYLAERRFPEKAIECLDAIGAMHIARTRKTKKHIGLEEVEKYMAKVTGLPLEKINQSELKQLASLEKRLGKVIFGQEKPIEYICQTLLQSRLGLKDEHKPVASFFFLGPTGVGKTELSKQIALHLGIHMLHFDMSEYQEKHSVSRFIGAPPGYVGHEHGGLLIDQVRKHPHSLILLDEFEKAHADIYNLFLQIMDRATITDATGRSADFRNCIIIMTSNIGAHYFGKSVGFSDATTLTTTASTMDTIHTKRTADTPDVYKASSSAITPSPHHVIDELNRVFTPEFRNRLDRFIEFHPLMAHHSKKIITKYLRQLKLKLHAFGIDLDWTNSIITWLATRGFSATYGARHMERTIKDHLYKHLSHYFISSKIMFPETDTKTSKKVSREINNLSTHKKSKHAILIDVHEKKLLIKNRRLVLNDR